MNPAELDAVLVDAYGTLVTLADPVPELVEVLATHGVNRSPEAVLAGVQAEIAHYGPRAGEGHDRESLARLQAECAGVFLSSLEAHLDPEEFAPLYVGALRFDVIPGVVESLERLQGLGLTLGVVANWDLTLRERLTEARLDHYFAAIVHAARKPAPDGLLLALRDLSVEAKRALYVGDSESDELAARAGGLRFAPAPLAVAVAALA